MSVMELREHVERVSAIDPSLLLGNLAWYEVEEATRVRYADFKALVESLGLPGAIPRPPADHNAFRRVVTDAERKRVESGKDGIYWNFMLRQMQNSGNTIQRRLVMETVDAKGQRLAYRQLADVFFNKDTSGITTVRLTTNSRAVEAVVVEILGSIWTDFHLWRGCLNGNAVRAWIRDFLLSERAVSVRTGVYFLSQGRSGQLGALERLGTLLDTVKVHSLPLVDSRKQREMLKEAFEDETVGEVDRLMAEIAELLRGGTKLRADTKQGYMERYTELTAKTEEYASLLEHGLGGANRRLSLFREQVFQLVRS